MGPVYLYIFKVLHDKISCLNLLDNLVNVTILSLLFLLPPSCSGNGTKGTKYHKSTRNELNL